MKRILLLLLAVFGLLLSCKLAYRNGKDNKNNSTELTDEEFYALTTLKENFEIPEDQVKSNIVAFINDFQSDDSRSAAQKSIVFGETNKDVLQTSLKFLSYDDLSSGSRNANATLGSEEIELYAYNLSNGAGEKAGFAIASGDERLPAILGYSPDGELVDGMTSDFLSLYFAALPDYVDSLIAEYNMVNKQHLESGLDKLKSGLVSESRSSRYKEQKGPFIPLEWGQGSPYSNVINREKNNTGLLSGCVAIAVSQIMASHRHARGGSYNAIGANYNWALMTERPRAWQLGADAQEMVGTLIYNVAENVNMDYGHSSSSASNSYVDDCFKRMGYRVPNGFASYSSEGVIASLRSGLPVYTSGYHTKKEIKIFGFIVVSTSYERGHAFAIDGYKADAQVVNVPGYLGRTKIVRSNVYFHMNLGWSGTDNGYYLAGVFNTAHGGNYKYRVRTLTNVSPIR